MLLLYKQQRLDTKRLVLTPDNQKSETNQRIQDSKKSNLRSNMRPSNENLNLRLQDRKQVHDSVSDIMYK